MERARRREKHSGMTKRKAFDSTYFQFLFRKPYHPFFIAVALALTECTLHAVCCSESKQAKRGSCAEEPLASSFLISLTLCHKADHKDVLGSHN